MVSTKTCIILLSIMHQGWTLAPLPPTDIFVQAPLPPTAPHPAPVGPGSGSCNQPIGFSARKAAGANQLHLINANSRIRFQETLSSFGSHSWDSSKFCTYCPGYYYFSFHAQSSENGDFTLALMKNGNYQVTAYGSRNGYQFAGNSAMIYLKSNDCVWLQLQDGTIYAHPYNEAYTTFTGFRVDSK